MSHLSRSLFDLDPSYLPLMPLPYGWDDYSVGEDSYINKEIVKTTLAHYVLPMHKYKNNLLRKFLSLKTDWENDTFLSSSINKKCSHPAYKKIIDMGKDALPFIFDDLCKEPNYWFVALRAITGKDPVPQEERGRMQAMTNSWIKWWIKNRQHYETPSCYLV